MAKRLRTKTIRETVAAMLGSGAEITPDMLLALLDATVPETEARQLWARTFAGRLVHGVAKEMGLLALSMGPDRGFKAAETSEEFAIARARCSAQLKGQGKRSGRLKQKLLFINQHALDLSAAPVEEVGIHAGDSGAKVREATSVESA